MIDLSSDNNGYVICTLDGWNIRQYLNHRWYVTVSKNSPLARDIKRHKILRSHFVYMIITGVREIPLGYVLHHKDHNRLNDDFGNLQLMTSFEHDLYHREYSQLFPEKSAFDGKKHSAETRMLMSEIAQKRGNNAIWDSPKSKHFDKTKELMSELSSGDSNPSFRSELDPVEINEFYNKTRSLKQTAAHFSCSVSAIRYRLSSDLYIRRENPLSGRERKYQFDDAEMIEFYNLHGAALASEKYGCTQATIYYRIKKFNKEASNENRITKAA